MRILIWAIIMMFFLSFQGSSVNPFVIGGIRPDFILIAVYLFGIFKGEIKGGLIGAFLGFIVDIISAGPVYYNIFSKFFIGYFAGIIGRWIQNPGYLLHAGLISIVSLVQGLGMFLVLTFLEKAQFPGDILYIVVPQAIFDGVLGGAGYLFLTYRKRGAVSRWA